MVAGIAGQAARTAPGIGAVARAQAAIQQNIVAPGALLTVLSGSGAHLLGDRAEWRRRRASRFR